MLAMMALSCAPHRDVTQAQRVFQEMVFRSSLFVGGSPPTAEAPQVATVHHDFYQGWREWCEPANYHVGCKTQIDCQRIDHPAGWPLKCVRPWWSKRDEDRVCAPGYDGSGKWRNWRKDRLREIVRQQYFNETDVCDPDIPNVTEQSWQCQKEMTQARKLHAFLWLVYYRETTGRPWKRHKLSPDLHANQLAWSRPRVSRRYGWEVKLNRHGDVDEIKKIARDANPVYPRQDRWRAGLGPYGMVAASWTASWDPHAPPEILCREIEATELYLRRARSVWRKLKGGIDCNRDGGVDYQVDKPTLGLIHRAASGGKICPPAGGDVQLKPGFLRRMKKMGLNPDKPVPLSFFGEPIARQGQNARTREIYQILEARLPAP